MPGRDDKCLHLKFLKVLTFKKKNSICLATYFDNSFNCFCDEIETI